MANVYWWQVLFSQWEGSTGNFAVYYSDRGLLSKGYITAAQGVDAHYAAGIKLLQKTGPVINYARVDGIFSIASDGIQYQVAYAKPLPQVKGYKEIKADNFLSNLDPVHKTAAFIFRPVFFDEHIWYPTLLTVIPCSDAHGILPNRRRSPCPVHPLCVTPAPLGNAFWLA